ncbi:hypothetical protein AHAS_Ahas04G0204200 [Arachis hypogaea]
MCFLSSPLIFENNNKHPDNLIVIPKRNYLQFIPFDSVTLPPKHLLLPTHLPPHRRIAVQIAICSCPNCNLQQRLNTSALETRCSRSILVGDSVGIARSFLPADATCWGPAPRLFALGRSMTGALFAAA